MLPKQTQSPTQEELLNRRVQKLTSILDVAKAMVAERNLDKLLNLILIEAGKVVEADRCTLFILDREREELWSRIAQGASSEIRIPIGIGLAGAVARTGEVINLADAYQDSRFNRSFDQGTGYRTKTVLCVPMRDTAGDVTGVIQALNGRNGPFTAEDEELLLALAGQAAAAVENALLHGEISRLFEGFVSASVMAIESRDPSTGGHSSRVASLSLALAKSLEMETTGPYAGTKFKSAELQELRYASLLHDFGKVGVREAVLVKADKLYPHEFENVRQRFELARKDRQLASFIRRFEAVRARGNDAAADIHAQEEERLARELKELDEAFQFVVTSNRPTVLAQGGFEKLTGIGQVQFTDARGNPLPLLTPDEVAVLSIPKGSLSEGERREIESHVTHTYRFLKMIPWTRALRRVPEIAYAHHEKLNGQGYPRSIPAVEIPLQSKVMAITDIYDALTASDRPYKKAVPHQLALDILKRECDSGQLDRDLYRTFVEARIATQVLNLK